MHNIYYLGLSGEHCCPLGYLFSNIFSETDWPVSATFHVEPPLEVVGGGGINL